LALPLDTGRSRSHRGIGNSSRHFKLKAKEI